MFSVELDNRAQAFGVRAYSVHPCNTWGTELLREAPMLAVIATNNNKQYIG